MRLGQATNTDDAEGEVVAESDARRTDAAITAALPQFIGDIQQVPPKFSAVKIDGERAYKLARDGENVSLSARDLYVDSLEVIDRPDADHVTLDLVCGKGGYVRSIARDLGEALGCHGHVLWLRRVWSGPFDVEDGIGMEIVEAEAQSPALEARLFPVQTGLTDLPDLPCAAEAAARLRNGNPAPVLGSASYGDPAWASHGGQPVAVGVYRAGTLHPSRVFNL